MNGEDMIKTQNQESTSKRTGQDNGTIEGHNGQQQPESTQLTDEQINNYSATTSLSRRAKEKLPPPMHKLAFINAVKSAWLLQTRQPSRKYNRKRLRLRERNHPSVRKLYKAPKSMPMFPPFSGLLQRLSVHYLLNNLYFRHDLIINPRMQFHHEKPPLLQKEVREYWNHLDQLIKQSLSGNEVDNHLLVTLIRNILSELSSLLVSLISPFPTYIPAPFVWHWPDNITEEEIMTVLDPESACQQLSLGTLFTESKFDFVVSLLAPLLDSTFSEMIQAFLLEKEYGKALEETFNAIEQIKMGIANKSMPYYRSYLIETGPDVEWEVFLRQINGNELTTYSVTGWLIPTWERIGHDKDFAKVLNTGIVNLLTEDEIMSRALGLRPIPFPVSFRYDQRYLVGDLRENFKSIIMVALMLIPYRTLTRNKATKEHILLLKRIYQPIVKFEHWRSCHHAAYYACSYAVKAGGISQEDMSKQLRHWTVWLYQNTRYVSPMYKVMYNRVRTLLIEGLNHGTMNNLSPLHATIGLESDISRLGKKLIDMANYNKRTFRSLYDAIACSIRKTVYVQLKAGKTRITHDLHQPSLS